MNAPSLLKWGPAILAALTALLDVGHLSGVVGSEIIVLISAIVTAILAFAAAITHPEEAHPVVHPPQQQPPQPPPQQVPPKR